MSEDVLEKIYEVLNERKTAAPESSYVASLYDKGIDAILKKIGEESTETILAAKDGNNEQIIHETADLWFHCLVMLAKHNITPTQILEELNSRFGVSGHVEKASRSQ